jgi:hypothetical protein
MTITNPTTTIDGTRQRLGGVALVLGPGLLLAGALVHPREVSDAGEQLQIVAAGLNRWYLAHLLYVAATALFVPAVLALGRRLRQSAPRLELWGTGLSVVGLFSTAALVSVEGFGAWQLAQSPDGVAAAATFDRITNSAGIVVPFAILGLTLSAGLVALAVGLARTATAPAWVAWTLGVGAVFLAVGLAGAVHPAFLAGVVGIVVALATTGLGDLGLAGSTAALGAPVRGPLAANS